jgi:hypothetical protein
VPEAGRLVILARIIQEQARGERAEGAGGPSGNPLKPSTPSHKPSGFPADVSGVRHALVGTTILAWRVPFSLQPRGKVYACAGDSTLLQFLGWSLVLPLYKERSASDDPLLLFAPSGELNSLNGLARVLCLTTPVSFLMPSGHLP